MSLAWKAGFEVELMAPAGTSREDLARSVAASAGGRVERFFHAQSEPSKVPGMPVFENLTFGFRVTGAAGEPVAAFVDDLTLQRGLDRTAPSRLGWYRIVSDDGRLLRLVMRQCDPDAPLETVLEPMARLFGTEVDRDPTGMVKVVDGRNISVAIAAHLPGERERPCEIVTAPLASGHAEALDGLLGHARAAGFGLPWEGATHIHFDGAPLKSANAVVNMARVFSRHGGMLKRLVGTNPNCVRLGLWPAAFLKLTSSPDFLALDWGDAVTALKDCKLSKFCDFNLLNIVAGTPNKETVEIRVLPSFLEAGPILEAAELFESILAWCAETPAKAVRPPESVALLLAMMPLEPGAAELWQRRLAALG